MAQPREHDRAALMRQVRGGAVQEVRGALQRPERPILLSGPKWFGKHTVLAAACHLDDQGDPTQGVKHDETGLIVKVKLGLLSSSSRAFDDAVDLMRRDLSRRLPSGRLELTGRGDERMELLLLELMMAVEEGELTTLGGEPWRPGFVVLELSDAEDPRDAAQPIIRSLPLWMEKLRSREPDWTTLRIALVWHGDQRRAERGYAYLSRWLFRLPFGPLDKDEAERLIDELHLPEGRKALPPLYAATAGHPYLLELLANASIAERAGVESILNDDKQLRAALDPLLHSLSRELEANPASAAELRNLRYGTTLGRPDLLYRLGLVQDAEGKRPIPLLEKIIANGWI